MGGEPAVNPYRWASVDFQDSLCAAYSGSLALEGCRRRKPPRTSEKLQRDSRWFWIKNDVPRLSVLLGHKLGSDHSSHPGEVI